MVLKSYFDGGNQVDSQYDRISIAVVCGTANQWKRFNTDWKRVLFRHEAAFLHTTDAVSLKNEFVQENGWDYQQVNDFIGDCVTVVEKHIAIPEGVKGKRPRMGLLPITLTIRFDDWLRARQFDSTLPNTIEEICATESLSYAFKWGKHIGAQYYELYYDQGEKFYGHVKNRRDHPKARKAIEPMQRVVHLGESDMTLLPALQIADLFAWGINHANQEVREWHIRLHDFKWESKSLEYEHLINPNRAALDLAYSWKLPRRRSTELVLGRRR